MVDDVATPVAAGAPAGAPLAPGSAPPGPTLHAGRSSRRSGSNGRLLLWTVGIGAVLAVVAALSGSMSIGGGSTGGYGAGEADQQYSYYHDAYYDSESYGPQWKKNEGGLSGEQREWEYDGAYSYGKYGSAGMKARSKAGVEARDPLYTPLEPPKDLYAFAGSERFDPTGGDPVGDALLQSYDPNFNPYSPGYSNPYLNRIRLAYGPGYGRGAAGPQCQVC